jgi:drug/metabolite transporter (DMT)-like permease
MNDQPPRVRDTYTGYAIGCAVVWALIWMLAPRLAKKETLDKLKLVFPGWVMGWTSATIARYVYPPPKKKR